MLPLKLLVSTVLSTTGTSKTLVAFNSATLLLMIVWRSKLVTPKSIWGCRSIIATTQLSGVNRPFSLRFVAMISSSFLVLLGSAFLNCPDQRQLLCRLTNLGDCPANTLDQSHVTCETGD